MLSQRLQRTDAAKWLHELWLLDSVRKRKLLLSQMLTSDATITFPRGKHLGALRRVGRIGKVFALQFYLYVAAAVAQATPSGRDRMRFW